MLSSPEADFEKIWYDGRSPSCVTVTGSFNRQVEHTMAVSSTTSTCPTNSSPILMKYTHVFQSIGRFFGTYKITLQNDAVANIATSRKIPLALADRIRKELESMEFKEITNKVTEPSDRVSPIVTVSKKDGIIRIFIDPLKQNEPIKVKH